MAIKQNKNKSKAPRPASAGPGKAPTLAATAAAKDEPAAPALGSPGDGSSSSAPAAAATPASRPSTESAPRKKVRPAPPGGRSLPPKATGTSPARLAVAKKSDRVQTNGSGGNGREIVVHGEHAAHFLEAMKRKPAHLHVAPDHVHDPVHTLVRRYILSTDHKIIGMQFMWTSLIFMVVAGLLAMIVRWKLAFPNSAMPGGGLLSDPALVYNGVVLSGLYNQAFTMHASLMIFFVIIPMLVGAFGNFLIPLQIGARDMAFPFLNALSYWFSLAAGIIMTAGFIAPGGSAAAGWTSYPPVATTGATGQTLWFVSIFILGLGSIMGAINYVTTIINFRAPGMTWWRLPLTVWALFITAILVLFATPVLGSAMIMQTLDRTIGTSFFIPANNIAPALVDHVGGGKPLLFQHLFWFYSHPAVYIMILPAMGIVSEVLSVFSRKPVFGYRMMVVAIAGIAFLGFIVWGHHMFVSGMKPSIGSTFMVSTMLIAVPSAIKTFNWLGTVWGGSIRFTTPMLNALAFVSMFVIGGLSGIFMAATAVDIQIHDTYFIVGHIHYVLFGGSLFGIFAGIYHWYPKMFGRTMNESIGKMHFWLTFVAFNCTFFPMHILGTGGMMRRIPDPTFYEIFRPLQPWNVFITVSAFALGIAQLLFVYNFFGSLYARRKVGGAVRAFGDFLTAAGFGLVLGLLADSIARRVSPAAHPSAWAFDWANFFMPWFARPSVAGPVTLVTLVIVFFGLRFWRDQALRAMAIALAMIAVLPFSKILDVAFNWSMYDGNVFVNGGEPVGTPVLALLPWLYSGFSVFLTLVFVAGFAWWAQKADIELGAEAGDNPWEATTLEWSCTSPPWYANFETLPTVYHGPHEYNVPGVDKDWLPQHTSYRDATAQSSTS